MSNKKYEQAVIVANGVINDPALTYKRVTDLFDPAVDCIIIGADGGAENALRMNLVPDIVIGDMDSIKAADKEKIRARSNKTGYISTSSYKDKSDAQLAVEYAFDLGIKKIIILGALGGRIDHSIANIFLLASPFLRNIDIRILTDTSEIVIMRKSGAITGDIGATVTLISLSPYTYFIKTEGLKYMLENEKLIFSPVRGISNIFTEKKAYIKIKKGILLVIKQL
ncbi:MAG: thiamine diphosphokinase [Actinomycetota bacterium]|nr:thiamine diphosphokinase [Actinomycetota bacterium]